MITNYLTTSFWWRQSESTLVENVGKSHNLADSGKISISYGKNKASNLFE